MREYAVNRLPILACESDITSLEAADAYRPAEDVATGQGHLLTLGLSRIPVQESVTIFGSSNIDIRSFALNDEISLLVFHLRLAERLWLEEGRDMRSSKPLDLEDWARRPLREKTLNRVTRLFSLLL